MLAYIILFFYVGMLSFLSRKDKSGLSYSLSFLVLVVFSGFRHYVGVDYESYVQSFDLISADVPVSFELLNVWIIKAIFAIGGTNQLIFLVYTIIILSGVFNFIKKLSTSKELSVYIFFTIGIFFLSTLNGIRQWAAISMMLYAIVSLSEKKYYKSACYVAVAVLFHASAVILVFLPLLVVRFSAKSLLLFFAASGLASSVILLIINSSSYALYINGLTFGQKGSTLFTLLYLAFMILIIIYSGYFGKENVLKREEIILFNMCIMSIYICTLGYLLNIDFLTTMRVNMYFQIQIIILIPWLIHKISNLQFKQFALISVVAFCTFYFYMLLLSKGSSIFLIPYTFDLKLI